MYLGWTVRSHVSLHVGILDFNSTSSHLIQCDELESVDFLIFPVFLDVCVHLGLRTVIFSVCVSALLLSAAKFLNALLPFRYMMYEHFKCVGGCVCGGVCECV